MHATRRVFLGAVLIWLIQPGGLAAQDGLAGRVYEREADGGIGSTIASVEIEFTSEDGSVNETATSGADGSYRITLAPARYRVAASHSDYDPYSSGSGFFVVTGDGYQTANLFMTASSDGPRETAEDLADDLEYPDYRDRLDPDPDRLDPKIPGLNVRPVVNITRPADGARITTNDRIRVRGNGQDREDGRLKNKSLAWASRYQNSNGSWTQWKGEGTGRRNMIRVDGAAWSSHGNADRARYQIRLTGTDSEGASADDMIQVTFQIAR